MKARLTKSRRRQRSWLGPKARGVASFIVIPSLIAGTMRHLFALSVLAVLAVASGAARADEPKTTVFASLGPIVIHGDEADNLLLGVGAWDIRDVTSPAGTVEYRFGRKIFVIGFSLGLVANTDGGLFGYTGAYTDLSYKNFYLTPQLGLGGYHEGSSSDLGGVFEFRMSLDLAYRFDNGQRLGVRAAHISNASIHSQNPGEEEILLTYSFAIGPLL